MKKLLLTAALTLAGFGMSFADYADANPKPVASTAENPIYYSINSYNRGGVLTDNNGRITHIPLSSGAGLWRLEEADENGALYVINASTGKYLTTKGTTDNKTPIYIHPNGVNNYGWAISSEATISGWSCIDANSYDTNCGEYRPVSSDWQGTSWVFKVAELTEEETIADFAENIYGNSIPVASTDEESRYYVIASYNRNGYLSNVDGSLKHPAMTTASVWKLTTGTADKSFNLQNYADPTKYVAVASIADAATDIYIAPHKNGNLNGRPKYTISSTKPNGLGLYATGSCIDAQGSESCGTWSNSENDWQGTTWILYSVVLAEGQTIADWVEANANIHATESALLTARENVGNARVKAMRSLPALHQAGFLSDDELANAIAGLDKLPADFAVDAANGLVTELNASYNNILIANLNGKNVRLRNIRRDRNPSFPEKNYVTPMPSRNNKHMLFGTVGYPSAFNVWKMTCTNQAEAKFSFQNEASKIYIGAVNDNFDGSSYKTASGTNPCTPNVIIEKGSNGEAEFVLSFGSLGLNMDQNADKNGYVCDWNTADDGSRWAIEVVPESEASVHAEAIKASTDTEKHYYYIKGDRYMNSPNGGSFMVTFGETRSEVNTENQLRKGYPTMGSLWYFTEAGAGVNGQMTYYMHNAINDRAYSRTNNKMDGVEGESATPLYINSVKMYAPNTTFVTPNGFYINTDPDNRNEMDLRTFLDQSNIGENLTIANWSPQSETQWTDAEGGVATTNNGGVFYFLEALAEEVETQTNLYLNYGSYFTSDNADYVLANNLHTALPALYPEELGFEPLLVPFASVAEANAAIGEAKTLLTEACSNFFAQPAEADKYFHFSSIAQNYYLATDGNEAVGNEDVLDLSAMWQLVPAETNGEYYLYNHGVDKYLGKNALGETLEATRIPIGDRASAHVYKFELNGISDANIARISNGVAEGEGNNKNCLMPNADKTISILGNGVNSNHWSIVPSELETVVGDIADNIITFAGVTKNPTIASHHKVLISALTDENSEDGINSLVDITGEIQLDNNNAISLENADNGSYTLTIPAGYFITANNKLSAPINQSFTKSENGTVGIGEVEAAESGVDVIFDLQGRRLSAPVKGINIINGKKILVK